MFNSNWLPDFRIVVPVIVSLMTVTTIFPLPHQQQQNTAQQRSK